MLDDLIIWIVIIVFYAPLHFMLPVLFLFIVGEESGIVRKQLIRHALVDAAVSMVVAIGIAIYLVSINQIELAMVMLILFMLVPFVRILKDRRRFSDR